jgi:CheY-like chemotaxis protein
VNQKVVLHMLTKLGHRVEAVGNGLEALHALETIPYDLVLMDCQMPEMDGYEATRAIRGADSRAINRAIPIIALTAGAMQGDREQALTAGMDDYLSKPIDSSALANTLMRWLKGSSSATAAPAALSKLSEEVTPPEGKAAAPAPAVFDRSGVLARLDDDAELLAILIESFLKDIPKEVASLKLAAANGQAADARLHAHSIKGAASNVGAAALQEWAGRLENAARELKLDQVRRGLPELERRQAEFVRVATLAD